MNKASGRNKHKSATRDWFDRWSNEYDRTLGSISFHRGLLKLLVGSSGIKDGDRVLDIGCGTGLLSLRLLQKADCRITAIDNSRQMLGLFEDKLKQLRLGPRINCALMDAEALNFGTGTFDKAVSSVVLHHLKDKLPVIKKIYKLLKPGGVFIVGDVDMDSSGRHEDPKRLKRMLRVLEQEWIPALQDVGVKAFRKMYENGIKHILNEGEYCISLKQWAALCRKAGFKSAVIKRVPHHPCFGIVIARKGQGK